MQAFASSPRRPSRSQDTETYIVAGSTVDEMQSLMDDHIIKVQTMKGPEGGLMKQPRAQQFSIGWHLNTTNALLAQKTTRVKRNTIPSLYMFINPEDGNLHNKL